MIDSVAAETAGAAPADLTRSRRRKSAAAEVSRVDRLPPHSLEAEQGVLGCCLLSPNDTLGVCIEKARHRPVLDNKTKSGEKRRDAGAPSDSMFYDLRHQTLFEILAGMYDRKEAIDLITVQQRLKDMGLLEGVGGIAYLTALLDAVPSAANLTYYLDIVWEKSMLRKMVRTCTDVIGRVYEHEGEVDKFLDQVETDILAINQERNHKNDLTFKELIVGAMGKIQQFFESKGKPTGLSTGFIDMDHMTTGLKGGEMIVIAARPSMGKTSLAMNIVEHVVMEEKLPVGVFSLEMTAESLALRLLCSRARLNLQKIQTGNLDERDLRSLPGALGQLSSAPLFIDDTSGLSIMQLRAKARRLHQQHGIKLFVVDYLQLLHSTSRRAENRQQEITDISNGLKGLAKELNVPVIVLSQLNRELEKRDGSKPRLSDLRESGAIEQDADVVGLLYKADPNDAHKAASADGDDGERQDLDVLPVNLLIAKQRNGPTGDVHLTFLKGFTRFESAAKIAPEDV